MKLLSDLNANQKIPYLIAEIGINHNGDIQLAKKLIDASNACSWNCVKFQKRDPDLCVPQKQKNKIRETPWGKITYLDYKNKIEFQKSEYEIIDEYCKQKPIDWSISVWDENSLKFCENFDLPFIKIPSAHLTNTNLLKAAAELDHFVIISTGMSNWGMIDEAVNIFDRKNKKYALLHCNSSYPTPHEELNLSIIPEMKKRYDCIIGYSGHEHDIEPTIIATALGAEIIERHITLDHNMWGTDQNSSLEVHAMDILRKRLKDVKMILGKSEKIITKSEKPILKKLRG